LTAIAWNYNTLTAALQNWLDDTDTDWVNTTTLGQVVQLGEMRLTNDFDLTVFDTSATAALVFPNATGLVARPAGILVTDELAYQIPTGPSAGKLIYLERRDYSWVQDYRDPAVTGAPQYYAESDTVNWLIGPVNDQAYTLTSYGPYAPSSLLDVAATATTFMSTLLADVMLEACLLEASRFLKNAAARAATKVVYDEKVGPQKVRLRALLRNVIESPRMVGSQRPEGARPAHREE